MKPSARVLANRRNAQRSTGPRTTLGKSQVAKNALRHGLAASVASNPNSADEIERIARILAGDRTDPVQMDGARRIAVAQIDLRRIRQARLILLANRKARVRQPSALDFIYAFEKVLEGQNFDERFQGVVRALYAMNANYEPVSLEEGFEILATELGRLDRYERRALSRRKGAIRLFDQLGRNSAVN